VARPLATMALDRRVSRERPTLRRLVGRSAAWSTLDVVVGRFGQFAQGVIIARIVAPKDFGVFAIALVVHAVVVNISELGVTAALIRDDPARISNSAPTVATISLATSILLGSLVAALSPVLATDLGSANAAAPIAIMALNLPLAGFCAVPFAVLKRDFRMDRIFIANVANNLVSGIVVVVLALAGWGALALAWSWVIGQVITTLLLMSYRPGRFWPGWNQAEARRLLAFGLPLTGANLLAFLVLNVDYVVVGRILGAAALGLYMLAFNISGWPINVFGAVIRTVSLPGFSRLRLEGEAMPEHFVRALRLVAGVTLPICLIIGALARPAVIAIYGTRWTPAASALVGLSVLGAGRILVELSGDFLVSLGHTRALLAAQVPWLVALTATLLLAAPRYGIRGVGAAQAFVVVAIVGPVYGVLLRHAGVSIHDTLRALIPAILWALPAAAAARAVSLTIANPFLACAAGGLVGMTIAVAPFARTIVHHGSAVVRLRRARRAPSGASVDPADTAVQA
jgi:O-antigen/teichoic acid export membrane protein